MSPDIEIHSIKINRPWEDVVRFLIGHDITVELHPNPKDETYTTVRFHRYAPGSNSIIEYAHQSNPVQNAGTGNAPKVWKRPDGAAMARYFPDQ